MAGDFQSLDPLLSVPVRLTIVSALITLKQADFAYLLDTTQTGQSNLSQQIRKLEEAGYISIKKGYKDNYPHTTCSITAKGRKAFKNYVTAIKKYLHL